MKVSIKFEGGQTLDRALGHISERMGKRAMRSALLAGAEPIRTAASRHAPHAPGAPDLRENIGKNYVRRTTEQAAVVVGPTKGFAYGLPQELGTRRHAAQPFMRPAFDGEVHNALGVIRQELQRDLLGSARNVPQDTSESIPDLDEGSVFGGPGGGLL